MKLPPQINPDDQSVVSAWRRLAIAKRITAERCNRDAFDSLYRRGLAMRHSNGETGKYETFTFVLSTAAEEWLATNGKRPTFSEALEKMGAEAVKKAKRKWSAQQSYYRHCNTRHFPTGNESDRPCPTYVNADGEYSGLALTQWYVAKFCALNNLKP
jgi:hypothetical protein